MAGPCSWAVGVADMLFRWLPDWSGILKTFLLVLYLTTGELAYDDTVTGEVCHALAEALKEGGKLNVEGLPPLDIESAECREAGEATAGIPL